MLCTIARRVCDETRRNNDREISQTMVQNERGTIKMLTYLGHDRGGIFMFPRRLNTAGRQCGNISRCRRTITMPLQWSTTTSTP